jgi:hypothetical protein
MIGMIFYLMICAAASTVCTFFWVMTRPIRNKDEMRSWRVGIALLIVAVFLPYAAIEAQTRLFGSKMKEAVQETMDDAGIEGDLVYFKVLFFQGEKARILAIGEEETSWGGKDHPAVKMSLVKDKKKGTWSAESYNIIYSDNRNLDGIVLPPYW